jgi:signal transduction histidine kinase
MRRRQGLFSIEELEGARPIAVAIRTAPIEVDGRVVGAAWVMTQLVDPLFMDRSFQGYRLAAGLALGGIALAFALTAGLARTVRRQAIERERLQTDLRRSERLAALGKLLAGVAHEVRNPLAGIRSTAQLWQRGVVGLDEESLGGLVHEVDRLEEIVSRLLQFSRADAQDLVPGDLNGVVTEAARLAAGPAEVQGVRVELDLDPGLPPAAMAAPALLQVFRNLTTNAVQAMSPGGTLRLSTRLDPSRRAIMARVSDTGPGLAPEALKHLFEPFYTTKAEGTGLGLAIAREIALAHRGDLRAANRSDGPGAEFTLTLPVAEVRQALSLTRIGSDGVGLRA